MPQKKGHFRAIFRDGQRSVAEPGPTSSPWSILILFRVGGGGVGVGGKLTIRLTQFNCYCSCLLELSLAIYFFCRIYVTPIDVRGQLQLYKNQWLFTFGPGGLRAPCVLACAMRSLAIVITIDRSSSFWSRRACVPHTWWRTKRSWPLFHLLFLSFYAFYF